MASDWSKNNLSHPLQESNYYISWARAANSPGLPFSCSVHVSLLSYQYDILCSNPHPPHVILARKMSLPHVCIPIEYSIYGNALSSKTCSNLKYFTPPLLRILAIKHAPYMRQAYRLVHFKLVYLSGLFLRHGGPL